MAEIEAQARAAGFVDLAKGEPGERGFYNYKGKTIALVVRGRRPLTDGLRLVAAHIDAPAWT